MEEEGKEDEGEEGGGWRRMNMEGRRRRTRMEVGAIKVEKEGGG